MVLERSNTQDFPVGSQAPSFALVEPLSGTVRSLDELKGESGTVVGFLSVHCPFVKHLHGSIGRTAQRLKALGVSFVAISPNDAIMYPEDGPDGMRVLARSVLKDIPFLYDESQQVARDYAAKCTPDFYMFDKDLKLFYRGRLDGSTPGNRVSPSGDEICAAANSMANGEAIPLSSVRPSMGCSIKWK